MALLPDGGFAVAWLDLDDDRSIRLRLFDAADEPTSPELMVVTGLPGVPESGRLGPDLTLLGDQTLVVVWAGGVCGEASEAVGSCPGLVRGRRFSLDGGSVGEAFDIGDRVAAAFDPRVTALGGGEGGVRGGSDFVVVWTEVDTTPCARDAAACVEGDLRGRVAIDGELDPWTFPVNDLTAGNQRAGDLASTLDGGFVVVWESDRGRAAAGLEPRPGVVRRRFDGFGAPLESDVTIRPATPGERRSPAVTALASGGHLIAWVEPTGPTSGGGEDDSILVARFDENGLPIGPPRLAPGDDHGTERAPRLAAGASDDFFLLFTDTCSFLECYQDPERAEDSAVLASYVGAAEDLQSLPRQPLEIDLDALQRDADIAGDGAGDWIAVWVHSESSQAAASEIRARRLGFGAANNGLLLHGRFQVDVTWADFHGNRGVGRPTAQGEGWGTFWFFDPDNVELVVKMVDATAVDGRFWLFGGALTNVDFEVVVLDLLTGRRHVWRNGARSFQSIVDTWTFVASAPAEIAAAHAAGRGASARRWSAATGGSSEASGALLGGGRFELAVRWRDGLGHEGPAIVQPLGPDTAWVSFFHPAYPDLVVKVLDGRRVNGHFWVFYAGLTDVELELTVTDRLSGERAVYLKPYGALESRGDTAALPAPVSVESTR